VLKLGFINSETKKKIPSIRKLMGKYQISKPRKGRGSPASPSDANINFASQSSSLVLCPWK